MNQTQRRLVGAAGAVVAAVAIAWGLAYAFKFPPPQRLILRSQRSELLKLKADCEREIREEGSLYHQWNYPTMIQCAEHRYRVEH